MRVPNLDRALRRLIPSTSKLTFNPLFRVVADLFDVIPRAMFPEFRALPPNHLRIRVGVGNRLINNQSQFLLQARHFWLFVFSEGIVDMNADILDIGVGCGRWAQWLRDYNFRGRRFTGRYVGIDIDEEAIDWCRDNYDHRFLFLVSNDASASYNRSAAENDAYHIPLVEDSFDLVFSTSLFSHLLEAELENYVRESFRLLRRGGIMMHSHFNVDHPPSTYGSRHTFRHSIGNALIESRSQPEAAVAYRTDFLCDLCRRVGFASTEIVHMPDGAQPQPVLICRK